MERVVVDGDDISPDEITATNGWQSAHDKRRSSRNSATNSAAAENCKQPSTPQALAGRRPRPPQLSAIRHPKLPIDDHKIILRPRGGLNLQTVNGVALRDAILQAAHLGHQEAKPDTVIINTLQHLVLINTPDPQRRHRYLAIKSVLIKGAAYDIYCYQAAPEDCARGVVHGVPLSHSYEDIQDRLNHERNPPILDFRRMGSTESIIILFEQDWVPKHIYYSSVLYRCYLFKKKDRALP